MGYKNACQVILILTQVVYQIVLVTPKHLLILEIAVIIISLTQMPLFGP